LALYARSRAIPAIAATVVSCAVALWALGLVVHGTAGRALAALLLAAGATTAMGPSLAGPDHDLDKAAGLTWPAWRAVHIVASSTVVLGLLAATALAGERMASVAQMARNVGGLVGLLALGAVVLGATRAPLVPLLWMVPVLWWAPPLGEAPARPTYKVMLTWMVQPIEARAATVVAVLLGAVGTVAYAARGSRR